MMLVITLQTNDRDPELDDDDGERRLYVNKPGGMFAAIMRAIKASNAKFAIGGTLAVKYEKNGKPTTPGFNPPKEYIAKYTPPGGAATPAPATQMAPANASIGADLAKAARVKAWQAFRYTNSGLSKDKCAEVWKLALKEYFGMTDLLGLSATRWQKFIDDGFVPPANPIGEAGTGVAEDEIPF